MIKNELDALEAAVKAMTAGPYVVVEQDGVYWIDSTNPAFDEGREILAELGWGPNAHAVALLLNRLESILAMARRAEAAEGQLDGILDLLSSQGQTTLVAGIRANMKAKS